MEDEPEVPSVQPMIGRDPRGEKRFVFAGVPNHHEAGPVLARRNRSLKESVVEGVVGHPNGKSLDRGVPRGSLRDRPRDEAAGDLEPEVVVKGPRPMLLNDESEGSRWRSSPTDRFAHPRKVMAPVSVSSAPR